MEQTDIIPNVSQLKLPKTHRFGGSHGLLIEAGISGNILIDCNFPKQLMRRFLKSLNNRVDYYFVTHFHMDHTAHVHLIEEWTKAAILMPKQEIHCIKDLNNLIEFAGIGAAGLAEHWKEFGYKILKFRECKSVESFTPGTKFTFGDISIQTLHLPGHSPGHTGFIISSSSHKEKILHVADIGLDSFGPWYGFENICSLSAYFESIQKVENLLQDCDFLVSSHTDVFTNNFETSVNQMRLKIMERENLIYNTIKNHKNPISIDQINALDLIFSKNKFSTPQKELYQFWERGFLQHHLARLLKQQKISQTNSNYFVKSEKL